MKKLTAFLVVFCMLFGNIMINVLADDYVTIYVAGDSSAASYGENRAPLCGWAQVLGNFLPNNINVKNRAESGRSSKSFVDEGRLDEIIDEIQPGDYLIIQFGGNDQKSQDPSRYTEPRTTYKEYLKKYIDLSRQKGAIPILATSIERRSGFSNGKFIPTLGDYPQAMRELAAEEEVVLVDLTRLSIKLYEYLGDEGSKKLFLILQPGESPNYPDGITDNSHLNEYGAAEVAKLFLSELAKTNLPIAQYIKDIESPLPKEALMPEEPPKAEQPVQPEEPQNSGEPVQSEVQLSEDHIRVYEQAMEELARHNILKGYEDGGLNVKGGLTRAEFTAIMTRALSLEGKGGKAVFSDVPDSHWAASSISAACENNILSGYGDGRFGPEDPVTFEQAASVVIRVLGYEKQAAERAPYPYGALLEAAYSGILDFVNANVGNNLIRGQAAQMLYNAFYAPMAGGGVLADRIIGKTYFVSPDGSDSADGSYESPWKSFKKAAETLKAGETAVFKPGKYMEEDMAAFAGSGTAEAPITLMARRPGEVEIAFSGAETAVEIPKGSENINLRRLNFSSDADGGRLISIFGDNSSVYGGDLKIKGGAAVYSESSRGVVVEENNIENAGIVLENVSNAIVRRNNIAEGDNIGIWIFGESKNAQIYSNQVYSKIGELSAGISISAKNSVFWNNVIVSHSPGLIKNGVEYSGTEDCHGYNNIIVGSGAGIYFKGQNTGPVFKNNIFLDCTSDAYYFEDLPEGMVSDYNAYYNTYPKKLEKNSKFKTPGFVDKYSDWHLMQGSPAIGSGAVIPSVFKGADGETMVLDLRDFDKKQRGLTWNMGIYSETSDLFMAEEIGTGGASGSAILSETFEAPNVDWVAVTGTWETAGGVMRQTDEAMGRSIIRYTKGHEWTDYEVSASVKAPPKRPESTTGIIFRADEGMQNMYVFRLYENAQLEFAKWEGGRFVSIEKWDYTIIPDRVYNLKVQASGNKLKFFVDGVMVKEITDSTYSGGTVGLYSFKQIGEFDNVRVVKIGSN